ncbi:MAG: hypothetical protein Hyperionvirus24_15 [Hyperionvirus sp.]|uniref:Ankyrin repeat protein n=1 Tax=Hyperionvirus sp. TaxID=2487770 RepID=A0A3G5AET2_9VIRU|nr:MAG: hypothetical protein Hyperionvirus24_15 [Hyperionvirus sp.]
MDGKLIEELKNVPAGADEIKQDVIIPGKKLINMLRKLHRGMISSDIFNVKEVCLDLYKHRPRVNWFLNQTIVDLLGENLQTAVKGRFLNVVFAIYRFCHLSRVGLRLFKDAIQTAAMRIDLTMVQYLLSLDIFQREPSDQFKEYALGIGGHTSNGTETVFTEYTNLLINCCGLTYDDFPLIHQRESDDKKRVELIAIVLAHGSKFLSLDTTYLSRSINAAVKQGLLHVTRYLIKNVYNDTNYSDKSVEIFHRPFERACIDNNVEIVKCLIQITDKLDTERFLHSAALMNRSELFDVLLIHLKKPKKINKPIMRLLNGQINFMRCLHIYNTDVPLFQFPGFKIPGFQELLTQLKRRLPVLLPQDLLPLIIGYC